MVKRRTLPQDRGWAWMCVLSCFLVNAFEIGGAKSFGVLFVEFQDKFAASSVAASWIMSLNAFLGMALGPLATSLGMRFTNRMMIIVGGILVSIGYLTSAFAPSVNVLYVTYGIIAGCGIGLSFGPSIVMISCYFKNRLSLANGLSVAGSGVGNFFMPPLIRVLIDNYALKGALIILGAIMSNICICGMLMRPPEFYTGRHKKQNPNVELKDVKDTAEDASLNSDNTENITTEDKSHYKLINKDINDSGDHLTNRRSSLQNANLGDVVYASMQSLPQMREDEDDEVKVKSSTVTKIYHKLCTMPPDKNGVRRPMFDWTILKNPLFLVFFLSVLFSSMGYPSVFVIFPAHAQQRGVSKTQGALLVSLIGIADLVGRILFGWFADLQLIKRKYGYMGAMFLSGAICFLFPFFSTFGSQAALCVFFGLVGGSYIALTAVMLVDALGRDKLANAYGMIIFGQGCAMLICFPFVSFLQYMTGNWDASFYFCGTVMIFGSSWVLLEPMASKYVRRKEHKTETDESQSL